MSRAARARKTSWPVEKAEWDDSRAGRAWDGAEILCTPFPLSNWSCWTALNIPCSPGCRGGPVFYAINSFKNQRGTQVSAAEHWNSSPSAFPGLLGKVWHRKCNLNAAFLQENILFCYLFCKINPTAHHQSQMWGTKWSHFLFPSIKCCSFL